MAVEMEKNIMSTQYEHPNTNGLVASAVYEVSGLIKMLDDQTVEGKPIQALDVSNPLNLNPIPARYKNNLVTDAEFGMALSL